jgi:hypothetical protein
MALWVCADCSTAFAVGQLACPHCGSTIYRTDHEEGIMPKISKHGGDRSVTNALAENEPAVREMLQEEADAGIIPEDRVDLEGRNAGVRLDEDGNQLDPEDVPYGATVQRADENTASLVHDPGPLAEGADGDVAADSDDTDDTDDDTDDGSAEKTTAAGSGSSDKSASKTGGGKTSGPTASGGKPSSATTGKTGPSGKTSEK